MRFISDFPDIMVEILLVERQPNFSEHNIDIAIIPARNLRDSALIVRKLGNWDTKFVASPAYVERYGMPSTLEALSAHPLLLGTGEKRTIRATPISRPNDSPSRLLKSGFYFGCGPSERQFRGCGVVVVRWLAAVGDRPERFERATWSRSDSRQTEFANNLGSRMRL
jgi:hypothetical protein